MSESSQQIALIKWWDFQCKYYDLPKFALYSTPNGGTRNVIEAVNLKRQGVRAGIPDLMLCVPRGGFHGLYIEMKWDKNKCSTQQSEVLLFLQQQDYKTAVCYDWEIAKELITNYLTKVS